LRLTLRLYVFLVPVIVGNVGGLAALSGRCYDRELVVPIRIVDLQFMVELSPIVQDEREVATLRNVEVDRTRHGTARSRS
jgi:hypothetical protein